MHPHAGPAESAAMQMSVPPQHVRATRRVCGMWVLREGRRLTCRFQNRHPQVAIRVDLIAFSNRKWNRDMDKAAVPSTDDHFRAAAHGCVNGVMRQSQAVQRCRMDSRARFG